MPRAGVFLVAALAGGIVAAAPTWTAQQSGTPERLRGVSAVSTRVAWASGDKGTVVRTVDGGAIWTVSAVRGADSLDFRDVEADDDMTAWALSIGPGDRSRIYRTTDGGQNWTLQFANSNPSAFYDAIAFWDRDCGLAVGDPVDGRFTILRTVDGGKTWSEIPPAGMPPALPGEGAFAASGTCLVAAGTTHAWFGTGGAARARVFRSIDRGLTWSAAETPIAAGVASAGIFSVAFRDDLHGIAVGGDYRKEGESSDNLARTDDGGRTWTSAGMSRLRGFRSAVAYVPGTAGRVLVAVGPAGTDLSRDGGTSWTVLGEVGFHALSIADPAGTAWAVGEQGRIAKLTGTITFPR